MSVPLGHNALLSYYGFLNENGGWPVDSDGRLHLLGEGNIEARENGSGNPDNPFRYARLIDFIENAPSEPVGSRFTYYAGTDSPGAVFAEAVYVSGVPTLGSGWIYRSGVSGIGFDARDQGLGAADVDVADFITHIKSHTWYPNPNFTGPSLDVSNVQYNGYTTGLWGRPAGINNTGLSHFSPNGEHHYWNPYQGSVFFLRVGSSSAYRVYMPVEVQYRLTGSMGFTPPTFHWFYRSTGSTSTSVPPMTPQDIHDMLAHDDTEFSGDDGEDLALNWTPEPLPGSVEEMVVNARMPYFSSTRLAWKISMAGTVERVMFDGDYGDLVRLEVNTDSAPVFKVRPDGSAIQDGSVPSIRADMRTRSLEVETYRQYFSGAPFNRLNVGGYEVNGLDHGYSFWARHPLQSNLFTAEAHMAAFVRRRSWCIEAGIGIVSTSNGSNPTLEESQIIWLDQMPLAATITDRNFDMMVSQSCNAAPPSGVGWQQLWNQGNPVPGAWCNLGEVSVRFTALLSDGGTFHDPRLNTANNTVEDFLGAGDGLCYEGEHGTIPRPRSGVNGTLLGQSVNGGSDFAIDVVRRRNGELMAVMITADRVIAWTPSGVIWDDTHEASIPPPVRASLDATPPSIDLRFLHPAWPTPTGVLSVGGRSLILTPSEREHRGYSWQVGGRNVSPPFLLHPGWLGEERYPYPDPRNPLRVSGDNGGGGVS